MTSVAANATRPYYIPRTSGGGKAIVLAVVIHIALAVLLFFGVRWQSSVPATIEAEVWSALPQTAAPRPTPVPPPARVEAPQPQPKVVVEPPKAKPDIAEQAPIKVEPKKKKESPKIEAPKPQPKPEPAPPKVEAKKVEPVRQAKPAVEAPARPPSDLANILASASEGTGKDAQTSGPRGDNKGYIARLVAAIRSQARYAATSSGNPVATVRVEQLPNGEVTNVTIVKSSGVVAFDEAVERAVRLASPLPRDENGKVERQLQFDYKMYERP